MILSPNKERRKIYFPLLSKALWSKINSCYIILFSNLKQKNTTLLLVKELLAVTWILCILRHPIHSYMRALLHEYMHIFVHTYIHTYIHKCLCVCYSIICSLEDGSIYDRKYLGNMRHLPKFIPFKSQTTYTKTWTD